MTTYRLWPATDGPGAQVSDPDNYTMGVEFRVSTPGCTLTQIHFWASAEVAGSDHVCRLYTAAGTPIAGGSGTFPSPLQPGWNTVTLASPVTLAVDDTTSATSYLACVYFTTDNGYTATGAYWTSGAGSAGVTSGPLFAPPLGGQRGPAQDAFNAGADAAPNAGFNGGNYWVDLTVDDGAGGPADIVGSAALPLGGLAVAASASASVAAAAALPLGGLLFEVHDGLLDTYGDEYTSVYVTHPAAAGLLLGGLSVVADGGSPVRVGVAALPLGGVALAAAAGPLGRVGVAALPLGGLALVGSAAGPPPTRGVMRPAVRLAPSMRSAA